MKGRRLIVTGGGTAGHIYPLLQVIDLYRKRHAGEVLFVGGRGNLEEELVPEKVNFKAIPVGKLRRYPTLLHLRDATRIARGLISAYRIVKKFKPDLILAKGGYVSMPIILAGYRAKVPIVTHESDSILGLTNRFSSQIADKVCLGFPKKYYSKLPINKLIYTGIPIRPGFFKKVTINDRQQFSINKKLPVILITGGSQGANAINNAIYPIIPLLLRRGQIIHLTGKNDEEKFLNLKNRLDPSLKANYHPFGYLKNGMEAVVRLSDLAVSRAGSTIFELAAGATPMILVPLPNSAGGHQLKNAEIFTKEGAALTIRQHHLTPERLRDTIISLLDNKSRLIELSRRAKVLAIDDATDRIVRLLEEIMR